MGGTKIRMSFAYDQKIDGETQRTNKSLKNTLRLYVGKRQ